MVATVPRQFAGETVAILAGGPSMTREDAMFCRDHARVIAIKDCIELVPDAEVLYSCGHDGRRWWQRYGDGLSAYQGLRYTLDPAAVKWASVLKNTGEMGLETSPDGLRTGRNSGYQAINLAVHLGAKRVVLLGYDMQPSGGRHHWFGETSIPPYEMFQRCFPTIVEPLKAIGVEVLNATRSTALTCFPQVRLEEAFS